MSWICLPGTRPGWGYVPGRWVSILVVVDLPPGLAGPLRPLAGHWSFNPCCRGSASRARRRNGRGPRCRHDQTSNVSILVVVDLPPGLLMRPTSQSLPGGFQSLLSWICLPGAAACGSGRRSRPHVSILVVVDLPPGHRSDRGGESVPAGFNPCCRGSASRARRRCRAMSSRPGFQSLLSWICLPGSRRTSWARR